MLSLRGKVRCFNTLSRLSQEHSISSVFKEEKHKYVEEHDLVKRTRGKKKAPEPPELVILNARASKILQRLPKHARVTPGVNILDPYEFEVSRKRLLQFKSEVSLDQIISSIQYVKPDASAVSVVRFRQIKDDLQAAYSGVQLRGYIAKNFPALKFGAKAPKKKLVDLIMSKCWNLTKSQEINSSEDLLIQRSFELSEGEMFVLLALNPITSWLRSNVQVIMVPSDQQLIIRANSQHVAYIEMALSRIFHNIVKSTINIEEITKLYQSIGKELPLDDIQRLSGVYMEQESKDSKSTAKSTVEQPPSEAGPEMNTSQTKAQIGDNATTKRISQYDYSMSALGVKRFPLAKRLMLWALDYNPFVRNTIHIDRANPQLKWYKNILSETLPWIHKGKTWVRLKLPKTIDTTAPLPSPSLLSPKFDPKQIFQELNTPATSNTALTDSQQSITAVTFGHLLYDEATLNKKEPDTYFQTTLPQVRDKTYQLDSFLENGSEELEAEFAEADRHEYHTQIKFVPSPFNNAENYKKYPPLEFWIGIGEEQKGDISTLQVLRIINEQNSIVSLPDQPCDLKFLKADSESLIEPYDGDENWLKDQPGIKEFLQISNFDFSGKPGLKIADHVEVRIPGSDEVVRYDYVSMSYRKHLSKEFKGKLLQYATVEGGKLGGRTSEVLLVGKVDEITSEEFEEFANDSLKFAKTLHLV